MAEPWSNDLSALEQHTREQLRPLDATRAALSTRTPETKMRFFKTHPALAAIVAVLALTLVGGAAYAVVREVFIHIDPDKSADEIEKDVHQQLEAAGVPATVNVEKPGEGKLKVRIMATDPSVGDGVKISVAGAPDHGEQRGLRLELAVKCELTAEQHAALQAAASSQAIIDLAVEGGKTDDEVAAAVKQILADAGFHDVDVTFAEGRLAITIKSPPTK